MTKDQIEFLIEHEAELADAVAEKYSWWVGRRGVQAVGLERIPRGKNLGDHPYHIAVYVGPVLEGVNDGPLGEIPDVGKVVIQEVGQVELPIATHQVESFFGD